MTAITITDPTQVHLTRDYLTRQSRYPFYYGTLWQLRIRVADADGVRSLTGATIVMTISDGTDTTTRKTGVTSTGASAAQIVIDADQSAENVSDPDNPTGKGWCTVRSDAVAADVTAFAPFVGKKTPYDVGIKFSDNVTQVLLFAGTIEIPGTKTTFPIV
jgi:hypothetical protein